MRLFFTLLGLSFAAAGSSKLADQKGYRQLFQRWGWSTQEMQVVGLAEIAGGVLVALPATRRLGAVILTATSGTVLTAELRHSDGEEGAARAMLLLASLAAFVPHRQAYARATSRRRVA